MRGVIPSSRRPWQRAWREDRPHRVCLQCQHFQTPSTPTTISSRRHVQRSTHGKL